ncbi:MAG: acyl-CoA thioesterase [Oscillospiraceae bacterium]|nr:acyl-CoA thioesterase [Oscillospiraceae bacterium]
MSSTTEITVRYAETDAMGVVHHAVYPIWFEIARTDYIKLVGLSYSDMEKGGVMLPVTGITVKYHLPARYDDHLIVRAKVTRLTPARVEFAYTITRQDSGELLTEGTSCHAFVSSTTFKPLNFKLTMPEFFEVFAKEAQKDLD